MAHQRHERDCSQTFLKHANLVAPLLGLTSQPARQMSLVGRGVMRVASRRVCLGVVITKGTCMVGKVGGCSMLNVGVRKTRGKAILGVP